MRYAILLNLMVRKVCVQVAINTPETGVKRHGKGVHYVICDSFESNGEGGLWSGGHKDAWNGQQEDDVILCGGAFHCVKPKRHFGPE